MKRVAAGLLLLLATGCAGMDEFLFDDFPEMVYYGDEPVPVGSQPLMTTARPAPSSAPAQVTPAAYQPQSTREPELLHPK